LSRIKGIIVILCGLASAGFSQQLFKGIILDSDSSSIMPFVYVINKNTGNGTMSDNSGKFYLNVGSNDTVVCSFVGYIKLKLPVAKMKFDDGKEVKIVMRKITYTLNAVTVSSFKLKPYEKEHMKKVIENSKMRTVNVIESPITALYNQFSRRGKEQRKLAQIYEEVIEEEQVQAKLSPEILRNLTGDDNIDYERFRKYCYSLTNYYIINHDGYDLYYRVMECYYRWKEEKR
jgi:hypothetical protein